MKCGLCIFFECSESLTASGIGQFATLFLCQSIQIRMRRSKKSAQIRNGRQVVLSELLVTQLCAILEVIAREGERERG